MGAAVVYQRPDVPDAPVEGQAGHAISFPLIGTTNKIGVQLVQAAQAGGLKLHVKTDTTSEQRTAHNVLAETPGGSADNVIVAGAHLDSVIAGPGINDNGSGTATILTIAEQINKLGKGIKNKVRFAFWGAEEGGDLGSKHYVTDLSDAEKSKIALDLNFDMVGSPNGVRAVYDGDDSLGTGTKPPAGSGDIEKVFADYYAGRDLALKQDPFTASSDYQPFLDAGIPAGGVRSGTDGIKTPEEASVYGGEAGKAYDPCYHQACDVYGNVNTTLLDQLADGAAHAVETFATSTTPSKADRSPSVRPGSAARAATSVTRSADTVTESRRARPRRGAPSRLSAHVLANGPDLPQRVDLRCGSGTSVGVTISDHSPPLYRSRKGDSCAHSPSVPSSASPPPRSRRRPPRTRPHIRASTSWSSSRTSAGTRRTSRRSPPTTAAPAPPGEPGFEVSTKYIVNQLTKAGYKPTVQDFPFDYYKEKTPAVFDQPRRAVVRLRHGLRHPRLLRLRRRHRQGRRRSTRTRRRRRQRLRGRRLRRLREGRHRPGQARWLRLRRQDRQRADRRRRRHRHLQRRRLAGPHGPGPGHRQHSRGRSRSSARPTSSAPTW